MRQEKERFFQIIFEENSHVLFRYICGQLNNDRETAKDVLNLSLIHISEPTRP